VLSAPPWGRTSCNTIFWPSLGNCNIKTYLISLLVYPTVFQPFFVRGGPPKIICHIPGNANVWKRVQAGSLPGAFPSPSVRRLLAIGNEHTVQTNMTWTRTDQNKQAFGRARRLLQCYQQPEEKNSPRYFTDYLEFFVVLQNFFNHRFLAGTLTAFCITLVLKHGFIL
jgi:hypothetical protein